MDTEYVIDCAQELGEISPLEGVVLNTHPNVYAAIRKIVDTEQRRTDRDWIANECRRALYKSPLLYRQAASVAALRYRDHYVKAMVERLESAVRLYVERDLGWDEGSRSYQTLLLGHEITNRHFESEQGVNEISVHELLNSLDLAQSIKLRLQQDYSELKQTIRQLAPQGHRTLPGVLEALTLQANSCHAGGEEPLAATNVVQRRTQRSLRKESVTADMRKRAKSALKKASQLFLSMGKSRELNLFIAGKEVTLSHPESQLKFVVRSLGTEDWLIRRSVSEFTAHTPFELALFTKTDVFIGNLCVYFADSPVLDQILSLSLFIDSGEEEVILEKANFFGNTHWTPEFWNRLQLSSPQVNARVKKYLAPKTKNDLIKIHCAVPLKFKLWDPFSNPVKQWIQSWLGESLREYNAQLIPESISTMTFDRMSGFLGKCLNGDQKIPIVV
ncbi:hypothetical protein [Comamonas thiooxydans]|uniref:hypothetical protein n=1 Tax=Comamonas thiooxydans TaxID=363952 RepID=UPI000B41A446|nr:hypothetical protein [Comamonas thiooxydans]